MPSFLVETYVPMPLAEDASAAGRRVRAAALELSRAGASVRYVRTTLLPADETCFHLFVADSEEEVADVCRRAGLANPRIVSVVEEAA